MLPALLEADHLTDLTEHFDESLLTPNLKYNQ